MTWIPITSGLIPATQREHLVTIRQPWLVNQTPSYRYQIALAIYIPRFTEEYDGEIDDFGEYREEDDTLYCPAGWYETNTSNPDYGYTPIDGDVVAIQPAPKPWKPEE